MPNRSVIRVDEVRTEYQDYTYRTPIKFGGVALDRVTLLNVYISVSSPDGRRATGFGSMPLGNVWSFPSRVLSYDQTLSAMKQVAEQVAQITRDHKESGHPIDLTWQMEDSYFRAAGEVTKRLSLTEPIPPLCTLVAASPFDAALHDAYGKLHHVSAYSTYSSDYLAHDLSHYLGPDFEGEHLDRSYSRSLARVCRSTISSAPSIRSKHPTSSTPSPTDSPKPSATGSITTASPTSKSN